jgi:endonuclease/exonuclease/phosphatase family metal-dependent hydrolase
LLSPGDVARTQTTTSDATELEFTLLTYNVHGLSPITSGGWGDKRLDRMRRAFAPYQVVLLQEDFESQDLLEKGDRWFVQHGPGRRWRWGHLATAPVWIPCWLTTLCGNPPIVGSGLTTQVRNDHFRSVEALVSRSFEECRGYVSAGNDCFAAKGFTGTRLRLPRGMVVDVYNTHLDAGNSRLDLEVRWTQIRELARAVEGHSPDAVIIAGDFNANLSGGDRGDDFEPVKGLLEGLGLRDAAARPGRGSDWKVMDYILYRSGAHTRLELADTAFEPAYGPERCGSRGRAAGEDDCFQNRRGRALSDHPALFAHFRASLRRLRYVESEEQRPGAAAGG